jgi:hypothetical protein
MKHKNCGGEVTPDYTKLYPVEDGPSEPALRCAKCGEEILGNAEIVLEDEDPEEILPGLY